MGQYHILVNFTKKEYVHPHRLGLGAKLRENVGFDASLSTALFMLMAVSNNRGGGDFRSEDAANIKAKKRKMIGSWGGDYVAVIGDYYEDGDLPSPIPNDELENTTDKDGESYRGNMYSYVCDHFTDISPKIRRLFTLEFNVKYKEETSTWRKLDGTVEKHNHWSLVDTQIPLTPDMVITSKNGVPTEIRSN